MTPGDVDELRVAASGPNCEGVADRPDGETDDPETKAKAYGACERAVDDRETARRAAQQNGLGQRPVNRREEARHLPFPVHQTSAPPPKEKKDRKKLEAAKAIDRPNTIWTSRRKPPDVSPKARLRPVTMMMITATIFATGPSMLSRIDCSGAYQGIDEPPARAGAV